MSTDLDRWRSRWVPPFEAWLQGALPHPWVEEFASAQAYPVFGGGKRVRPLLAFAAFESVRGTDPNRVWPAAGAVELVHTYSLVHDDLPCMDDDDLRRGRPTVHRAYDEATAVLVGDALLTHAFSLLASAPWSAECRIQAVSILSRESGVTGMVGGQVADVRMGAAATDMATLTRIHSLKTGALIRASCVLGGLAADATADQIAALAQFGTEVGLAFQLADDLLDAEEDAGDDGSPSYVRLVGMEETRRRAQHAASEACAAIVDLPAPGPLQSLAQFIVHRDH